MQICHFVLVRKLVKGKLCTVVSFGSMWAVVVVGGGVICHFQLCCEGLNTKQAVKRTAATQSDHVEILRLVVE